MIARTPKLAAWLLAQRRERIVGFGVGFGRYAVEIGVTWPFQLTTEGDIRRWPFYNGQTILWGALRWRFEP